LAVWILRMSPPNHGVPTDGRIEGRAGGHTTPFLARRGRTVSDPDPVPTKLGKRQTSAIVSTRHVPQASSHRADKEHAGQQHEGNEAAEKDPVERRLTRGTSENHNQRTHDDGCHCEQKGSGHPPNQARSTLAADDQDRVRTLVLLQVYGDCRSSFRRNTDML